MKLSLKRSMLTSILSWYIIYSINSLFVSIRCVWAVPRLDYLDIYNSPFENNAILFRAENDFYLYNIWYDHGLFMYRNIAEDGPSCNYLFAMSFAHIRQ